MEDIVATLRVETRRVAVRSTDWLDGWRCVMLSPFQTVISHAAEIPPELHLSSKMNEM